ncbi:hypothetical protein EXIGLDRAFT_622699, partial [Exidia glandulosa HHB12029]
YCRLGPENRLFTLAMFHELHCLRELNWAFSRSFTVHHVRHCLTYLRHGVLCSADLTLEPGDFTERNFTYDRVGETHICRDWSAIYEEMERNWAAWNVHK